MEFKQHRRFHNGLADCVKAFVAFVDFVTSETTLDTFLNTHSWFPLGCAQGPPT